MRWIFLVALLMAETRAFACTSEQRPPTREVAYEAAAVVIHARVTAIETEFGGRQSVKLRTIRVLKGKYDGKALETRTSAACGMDLAIGSEYVFFLKHGQRFLSYLDQPQGTLPYLLGKYMYLGQQSYRDPLSCALSRRRLNDECAQLRAMGEDMSGRIHRVWLMRSPDEVSLESDRAQALEQLSQRQLSAPSSTQAIQLERSTINAEFDMYRRDLRPLWGETGKPATLKPDSLICEPAISMAMFIESMSATTKQPASKVLGHARAVRKQLSTAELLKEAETGSRESILLRNCTSSGSEPIRVNVTDDLWPSMGIVQITMQYRGEMTTLVAEQGRLTP